MSGRPFLPLLTSSTCEPLRLRDSRPRGRSQGQRLDLHGKGARAPRLHWRGPSPVGEGAAGMPPLVTRRDLQSGVCLCGVSQVTAGWGAPGSPTLRYGRDDAADLEAPGLCGHSMSPPRGDTPQTRPRKTLSPPPIHAVFLGCDLLTPRDANVSKRSRFPVRVDPRRFCEGGWMRWPTGNLPRHLPLGECHLSCV